MTDCNCKNKFHAFGFMEMAGESREDFLVDQQRQDDALAAHLVAADAHSDIRSLLSEKADKGAPTRVSGAVASEYTGFIYLWRNAFKQVTMHFAINNPTPGAQIGTIPEGYKPTVNTSFAAITQLNGANPAAGCTLTAGGALVVGQFMAAGTQNIHAVITYQSS